MVFQAGYGQRFSAHTQGATQEETMITFQIGDNVRATGDPRLRVGKPEITLYEGVIIDILQIDDYQTCLIEIAEGSGIWSHVKMDTICGDSLQKIE